MVRYVSHRWCHPRRGVSLMEVLFAIGIVITGLLGVISLLPVAAQYAAKGLRLDHASAVGMNAIHEFELRGMANTSRWRMADPRPNPGFYSVSSLASWRPSASGSGQFIPPTVFYGDSFCIDPRFIATHPTERVFPYGVAPTPDPPLASPPFPQALPRLVSRPGMWRITLTTGGSINRMTAFQANEVFTSQDDLAFSLPDDATLPPAQQYGANQEKRQSQGQISWFATLVPRFEHSPSNGTYDSTTRRDSYIISVVVVNQRDASFEINSVPSGPLVGTSPNERIADVVQFHGGFDGGGGGDLRLGGPTAETLDLQEGDWIMLCRFIPNASNRTGYFRWYKVVATDDAPTEVSSAWWTLDVALLGADWDTRPVAPPVLTPATLNYPASLAFPSQDGSGSNISTQAVIIKGAISVYEKTLRLETTSLWTD